MSGKCANQIGLKLHFADRDAPQHVNRKGPLSSCRDGPLTTHVFCAILRCIQKGQMLSTQPAGTNQVWKMEASCLVEPLMHWLFLSAAVINYATFSKSSFPRRLLEDYFVVLLDTFKLSVAITLTLFFYPVITFSIRIILISFVKKYSNPHSDQVFFLYFCQKENY